jgi:hypothetical protein
MFNFAHSCDAVVVFRSMQKPPDYSPTGPLMVSCPQCSAAPGVVCQVVLSDGLELIHVERIRAAVAVDIATVERIPHLVILREKEGIPMIGGCSACKDEVFATGAVPIGMAGEHLEKLE